MHICFILVEPAVPENIGASARALKTMGFSDLRLVNPSNHLVDKARWLAHGSHDVLENATVYENFSDSIKDLDFLIGTTAKNRSAKEDYYSPEEAKVIVQKKHDILPNIGIVFGREESGLKNEELKICDIASSIMLENPYPSINLAQSVMIYTYIFSSLNDKIPNDRKPAVEEERIFDELKINTSALLRKTKLDKNSNLYYRILERIATVNSDDAKLLLSVAKKLI